MSYFQTLILALSLTLPVHGYATDVYAANISTYIWSAQSGFQKTQTQNCSLESSQDISLRLSHNSSRPEGFSFLRSKPLPWTKVEKYKVPSLSLLHLKTHNQTNTEKNQKLFEVSNHYLATTLSINNIRSNNSHKPDLTLPQAGDFGYLQKQSLISLKGQYITSQTSQKLQNTPDPRLATGSVYSPTLDAKKNYQKLNCCQNGQCQKLTLFNVYDRNEPFSPNYRPQPYMRVALPQKPLGFFNNIKTLSFKNVALSPVHQTGPKNTTEEKTTTKNSIVKASAVEFKTTNKPEEDKEEAAILAKLPPLPIPVWDRRKMINKHLDWKCSIEHIQNYKTLRVSFHTYMKASNRYENLRMERVGKSEVQSKLPIYSLVRLKTRYIPSNVRQSIQVMRLSRNEVIHEQTNLSHPGEDSYIHRDSLLSLNKAVFQIPKPKADKIGGEFLTATTNEQGRYKLQVCNTPSGNEYFAIFNVYNRRKEKVGEIGANVEHFKLFRGMVGESIESFDQLINKPIIHGHKRKPRIDKKQTKKTIIKTPPVVTKKETTNQKAKAKLKTKKSNQNIVKQKIKKQSHLVCKPSSTQEPPFLISTNNHMDRKIYEHFYSPTNLEKPTKYIPLYSVVTPSRVHNKLQTKNNKLRIEILSLPNSKTERNLKKARFRLMSRSRLHREKLPMTFYKRKGKRLKLTRVKTGGTGFLSLKSLILPSRGAFVSQSELARKVPNKKSYRFIVHQRGGKITDSKSGKTLNGKAFDVVIRKGKYQTSRCCKNKKCETLYHFKEKTYKNKKPITIKINPKKDRRLISKILPVQQRHYKAIAESLNSIRRSAYGKRYRWDTKGIEYFEMYPKLNGGMRKLIFHPNTLRGPHNGFHYFNKRPGTDVKGEGAFLRPLAACTFNRVKEAFAKICKGSGCQTQWGDLYHPKEAKMHRTHHSGNCIDTRPFRRNSDSDTAFSYNSYIRPKGKKGKDGLKPKATLRYSRLRTTQFMQLVRQAGGTMMFFNDAKLRSLVGGGIRRMGGHSNHMHFCFDPAYRRRKMIKTCFEGLDTSKIITSLSSKKKKRKQKKSKKTAKKTKRKKTKTKKTKTKKKKRS